MRTRLLLTTLVATGTVLAAPPPPRVAQVTLLRGGATVSGHAAHLYGMIRQGDAVAVPAGSRLTVFFFASGRSEIITGPARFNATSDGSHLGTDHMQARIPPPALTAAGGALHRVIGDQYAAEISRGHQYASYTPLGTEQRSPSFRWQPVANVTSYHFTLMRDPLAAPSWECDTTKPEVAHLPFALEPGQTYFWSVNGDQQFHSIHVVSPGEAQHLAQARTAFDASPHDTADSLLMAASYAQVGLSDQELGVLRNAESRDSGNPVMHRLLWDLYGQTANPQAQKHEEQWLTAHQEL